MYKLIYTSFSFILLTVLVAGCSHTADRRLVLADTLMWTNPDSSLAILSHINNDSLTSDDDKAYHALLLTQAQFRCNGNCSSDSLINFALDYYSDNHNREHYTRSLIYK
ncbi:MAG: tetratricopeptide repeat protein, partial [Muribaculaceae bacterium]|nr:tetratricopeptide repeat protein [Muribaculaceae bacterium]